MHSVVNLNRLAHENSRPQSRRGKCALVAVLTSVLAIAFAGGCNYFHFPAPPPVVKETAPAKVKLARQVVVTPVEQKDLTYTVDTVGTLEPDRHTSIAIGLPGVVDEVLFKEGDIVDPKKNVLVRIDQEKYRSAVELAKANELKAASNLALAQDAADRAERLVGRKSISEEEATQKKLAVRVARAELQATGASRSIAERELEKSQVRPPYRGQINERLVAPGDFVREDTVIATIADISKLRLTLFVPEMAAARIKLGDMVKFTLPALSNRAFEAKIFYMSTVADPQTHMFECKADIPNPDPQMKPGLFARVQLTTEDHPDAVVVSEEAIRASERGFVVFVPETRQASDGKSQWVARPRTVQLGFRKPGFVEILSGVQLGEHVVTRGSEALENGTPIEFGEGQMIAAPQRLNAQGAAR